MEANGISCKVNCIFLSTFLIYGSIILNRKWGFDPVTSITMSPHEKLFKLAGLNGCIESTNTTHVVMLICAAWAHIIHKEFKLNIPSRTYNMTVNHCR